MSQQLLDDWKQEDLGQSNTSLGGVRSTLTVASDTTADRQARDMELASSLGFSPEIVAEQRSWAEQEQTARTIEKNAQFAKWAAEDKTNAAFARDDTKSMYDVFEIMAGAERSAYSDRTGDAETRDIHLGMLRYKAQNGDKEAQKEMEFLEQNPDVGYEPKDYGWGTRLAIRGTEGTVNVAKSILGAIAMLGEAQSADYIGFAPLLKLAGKQARKYGEELDQGLQDWQKKIALPEVTGVQKYAEDFVQNLPQIAATIGAGVATGGLGWLSGVLGVGAMASAQIAGGQYLDLTKKPALNIPTAEELDRLATQRVLNDNIAAWQKKTAESGGADSLRLKPTAEEVGLLPDGSLSPEYGVALNMARAEIIADEILNGPQSVPQDIARKAAFWNAAAQAPLEMIGLGKVFKIFKATGFGNVVKGVLESAATEFITETLQQYPDEFSQRWAEGKARGESGAQIWSGFYKDFWDITKEGMYSGLVAAPFGVLGGIGKVATDAAMARQARDFVAGHLEFHQKVEETKAKKLAPSVLQSALEAGGLTQNVDIPAAEVLRLHQEGVPILDAMGWEEADVQLEADRGGEMTAKLSRLHSYLDGDAFNNIITFARPARGVWNMAEAEQFDARIKEDVDKMLAEQAQDDAERSAIDAERTRIEAEFRQAMQSIPGLRAEVKGTTSLTDIDVRNRDTIESAVAYNMSLIDSLAATFSKYEKASDFYSRISTRGMMFHPQNGRLVTPQEYAQAVEDIEQREEDLAREEAERPFWDLVWHRVDPESLKADWPEAVKDFRARGLGQLFRPASQGGIAIDEIADELERRNLMPPGGGADALIEKLKEMSPPRRRRGGRRVSLKQSIPASEVVYPDNGQVVGEVPPEIAKTFSLDKPGAIVLNDIGLQHIEERHGDQIRANGFDNVRAFVDFVLQNVDAVYAVNENGRKYDIVSHALRPQGRVMIRLEFSAQGDFYQVVTAGVMRKTQYQKKTPLWERAHSTLFRTENPLATRRASQRGQSDVSGESISSGTAEGKTFFQSVPATSESVDAVRRQYEGTDVWMKAPNGQPTKLTEQQWLQVRTPEFKAWFGDWENDPANASKVVDENGEPLVVYHGGTGADISDGFTFDYKFIGRHASAEGYGFYFTSDKNIAQGYQDKGGFLIEGYLNIRKPMPLKQKKFSKNVLKKILKAVVEKEIEQYPDEITDYRDGFLANYADTYSMSLDRCLNEAVNILWENDTALDQVSELANTSGSKEFTLDAVHAVTGYDCFFANGYRDKGGEGGKIYVAWFPEQIKSTQNKGTFDPNNPNILYQDDLQDEIESIEDNDKDGHIRLKDGSYIYWNREEDWDDSEYILINGLEVAPESRRKGLGRKLLRSALARIKSRFPDMEVKLSADPIGDQAVELEDLVEFYESEGFDIDEGEGMKGVPMTWDGRLRNRGDEGRLFHDNTAARQARGFVEIAKGHEYTIQLLQNANLSTLLHETGHIALSEMEHLMEMGLADDKLRADYQKIREYLGLKEGDNLSNLSDPRMVQANEKFAKAMELYLREGKAPSANLEGAFSRFKRWLMRIYKSVTDNPYFKGVTLNEDIRGVFDRLLANDAEIRRAAEKVGISDDLRAELDALGLKGNKRARITSLIQEAQEQAADKLQKAREAGRKAKLAEWRKEAQALIEDEPERKALKLMLKTGLDMDAVVQLVGEEMKTQLVKRQPGSVRKEGGVSPEKVAWEAGFASPEEMIAAVVSYPKYQDRIKEIVAAKQEEHDALFDPDDYLFETEQLAAIEEQLAQNIADILGRPRYEAELSGETINGQPVMPTQEDYEDYGRNAQYRASREKLKAIAKDSLSRTKTSDALSPWRFRVNVRRLVNEERRALLRKDWAAAQKANYELRLNMELARQSAEMLTRVTKFRTHLTRFLKEKRNAPDARYAVAALAVPVGLTKVTDMISRTSEGKNFNNIKAWVEAINGEGFPFTLNDQLFVDGSPVLWNDMPIAQFEEWYDTLEAMMTVEEERRKVTTAKGKAQLKNLGEELAASIKGHNRKSDTRKVEEDVPWVQWLKAAHAEHLKADTIAMLADGDKMGPVWQHIVRPISQATWDEANRLKAVKAKLDELFSAYSREELVAMRHNRVYVQAIGESITRENALCALLNCGNESNLRRLMEGTGWEKEQVSAVLELCEEKDWELAQAIWDYLETFREESFALEEKLTGVRPKAIEAQAIRSPSGKMYRGGYYPVRYNPRKASSNVAPEDMLRNVGNAFPVVEHGSMKERNAGRGLDAPLELRLDVLTTHLTRTVHNLAFREPVITVGRILRQGDFKRAFMETAGNAQYKALATWLQDVASTQNQDMGQLGRAMSWTRERMALYTMGLRASTIVAQLTGGMASCVELGPRWMLQGTAKVFGHGRAGLIRAYQEAMAMSPMMQNRITSFDREVATATRKLMDFGSTNKLIDPVKRIDQWVREHAYIPMGYVQLAVDLPTWWGAYEKAMAENGGNPEAAAEYADHAVEITQVGGATKDLAGIQRHGEVMKIFTMYYSYFSCLYNISARKLTMTAREGVLPHAMQLAGLSMLWFVEPLISALLVNRGPDDDEAWYSWAAKEAAFNPLSMIVGVRDIANYEKSLLEGKNFGYRASPVFDLVETISKAIAVPLEVTVGGKDLTKGRVKTVAKGIGMAAGSPLFGSQAITSLFAFWDVLDGSEELRLADLVFGHRK